MAGDFSLPSFRACCIKHISVIEMPKSYKLCTEAGFQLEQVLSLIQLHCVEIQFGCTGKVLSSLSIDSHETRTVRFFWNIVRTAGYAKLYVQSLCTFFFFYINFKFKDLS